jgi:phage tail-like protein
MTQTFTYPDLRIALTPMLIPEALSASEISFSEDAQTRTAVLPGEPYLLAHPGETSELVVQMENRSPHPLHLSLTLEGGFPDHWYQIGTEGDELGAGRRIEAVVSFRVPDDFFEAQEEPEPGRCLTLDYEARLIVRCGSGSEERLFYAPFRLSVRPRSLYLNFVPTVYREVDFVGRLLKLFEQAFEPAHQTMQVLWAHLDPLTAPRTLLPFLAHWVAWPMDERWSEARQRRLIRHAVQLYRLRGTRSGLRLFLHLYTGLPLDAQATREADRHISIVESSGLGLVLGQTRLGRDSLLGGGRPYHFVVRLREQFANQVDPILVRRILDQEKPAHCTWDLAIEAPLAPSTPSPTPTAIF